MSMIPLSLQLWSLRESTQHDFARTVAEVAGIGFAGVETAGFGNLDVTRAARAIFDVGLKVSGMHVPIDELRADVAKVIREARLLGTQHVVCPYLPAEGFATADACTRIAGELDAIGAQLHAGGMQFHYHNHAAEMAFVEGRRVLDRLLDASQPRHLLCEADVYWVQHGGKDPTTFIHEQGRRIKLLHVKDEREIGSGPVNFSSVFAASEAIGCLEWYVIEVEKYSYAPLDSVRRSFAQLAAWGKT